jgi:hypothetical protein
MNYVYLNLVHFKKDDGFQIWADRAKLFGKNQDLDTALIENLESRDILVTRAESLGFSNVFITTNSSLDQCFFMFYSQDNTQLTEFLSSTEYQTYDSSLKIISENADWEYFKARVTSVEDSELASLADFAVLHTLWDNATPLA